jgi:hypothetical protein
MSKLVVSATAPGTDLAVYDWRLKPVAQGRDQLVSHLPAGLYKVYASGGVGSDRSEVVDLAPDTRLPLRISNGRPVLLPIAGWGSTAAEAQATALDDATRLPSGGRRRPAAMVIMLRGHGASPGMPSTPDVASWFTLLDEARHAVAAFDKGWKGNQQHGYALTAVNLAPGSYTLRTNSADPHPTEQSLFLAEGWRTLVVIPMTATGVFPSLAPVIMCPVHQTWNSLPEAAKLMSESVFSALRTGRLAISRSRLERAADHPVEDPLLAIIAADPVLAAIAASQLLRDRVADTPLAQCSINSSGIWAAACPVTRTCRPLRGAFALTRRR